ncbi:hypothetical protein [Paenibacillus rigui]|uniref:Uncharacterized protein n=1 Tax=Paenibacillus rigui TaxID=554312 RepID=A0A229UUJ0_9BACL|nr:hypothetical protein [Paenibacillus rigui]OXM86921.1 hypothetical protein CF651_08740 [Paenibacillus rigui]
MVPFTQRWMLLISFLIVTFLLSTSTYATPDEKLVVAVKVSAESAWETRLELNESKWIKAVKSPEGRAAVHHIPATDTYLTFHTNHQTFTYLLDAQGRLFDEQRMERLTLPEEAAAELLQHRDSLRSQHYGQFLEWDQAKQVIPKKTKFKVIDMETGLGFHVQRRAGSSHADVQPLTKEDTAVMKRIYGGVWSWTRRSIIIETDTQQRIAASMHGMPHGGDGIPDNDFSGHFCIHFPGSSTHGSGKMDPGHQLMIYKAAGRLDDYMAKASPTGLIDTFFLALNLHDRQAARMSFAHGQNQQLAFFLQNSTDDDRWVHQIHLRQKEDATADALALEIPVDVRQSRPHHKEARMRLTFQLKRSSPVEPWKIDSVGMVS